MAAPKIRSFVLAGLLAMSGVALAQEDILFEDPFTGVDGTVIPTGNAETYRIVGRDGTLMTPTIANNQLALSIGPNPSGSNSFSALHINDPFDFQSQPLLFETDVTMGDPVTMVFALHTWLGNTRIEGSANVLSVGFFNGGTRLLLAGKNGGTETVRYEITDFGYTQFKLGVYLDETTVKLLLNGLVVFSDNHGLSLTAFANKTYQALQLYGGGSTAHTSYFDNLRVIANPDLTPPPTTVIADTFDGEDGGIPLDSPSPYRTALRTGVVMDVSRENEALKISMGPNDSGNNNFSMLHHNNRLRFNETPLLFEVDVDGGDMNTVAIGLHTWLGNDSLLYGNNVSATLYSGGRIVFQTLNGGAPTGARYESGPDEFADRKFRLGFYLDATEIKFLINGEVRFEGPHELAPALVDDGAYFGIQVNGGGDWTTHTATFDNLLVTANPDMTPPVIIPGDIFWATASAIRSSRFDGTDTRTLVSGLGRPIGLAVNFDAEKMYWVENNLLMQADTTGANVTELRTDLQTGQLLTFDAASDRLYWAEWDGGLFSSPSDGTARNVLISDLWNQSAGVALSSDRAFLVSAAAGVVTGYNLDGTGSPESVTTFSGQTYAIATAPSGQELFATNFAEHWIKAYDLQTGATRTVWDQNLSRPLGLVVSSDGEKLYWAERTLDVGNGRIRVANADGTGTIATLVDGEASPFGIAVRPVGQTPEGFAGWIAGFELGEGENGPEDAPAGDGVPNLLKYALGLNPTHSARGALPAPAVGELEGSQYLTLTVERNPDASGISWVFEVSTDLATWSSAGTDVMVVDGEGSTTTAWSTAPIAEVERQFIRVRLIAD